MEKLSARLTAWKHFLTTERDDTGEGAIAMGAGVVALTAVAAGVAAAGTPIGTAVSTYITTKLGG